MAELLRKICSSCKEDKDTSFFSRRKGSKDGYQGQCKSCMADGLKKRKAKYRSSDKAKQKERAYKQSEKYKEYAREYRQREEVKEKARKSVYLYSKTEQGKHKRAAYRASGREAEAKLKYQKRHRSTPKGVLDHRMNTGIRTALKGNKQGQQWESLAGYSCEELKIHLESLFTQGMTWKSFLSGEIHIDHIIPKSLFKYESAEEEAFKKCWSLDNLQPLWATDNLIKGIKTGGGYYR